ncbi:MAG: SAM-dependent methyltransferase, partial [Candidatus Brocadia sp.]
MQKDTNRIRQCLRDFDFKRLFIEELGWDSHSATLDVLFDKYHFELTAVAQKRGMSVFTYTPSTDGHFPDYQTRRKIDRQVAKTHHEHLIIYTDANKTSQVWQWVKREAGRPIACREHTYHHNQSGDLLIQKLQTIAFSLEEEEALTLPDVTGRVRAGFDVERVTRRFYDRFKTEHDNFLGFLEDIPDESDQRWYASVMLNRLMFIYFIQKKGFLDGNSNYLPDKLGIAKSLGRDRYYRDFLCPLFFEGFAKKESERPDAINRLLGRIPYLNGGLFLKHQIEELHGQKIQIADDAFEKLFDFFEQYQWHLDERPLRQDNEINPDVLGYIFEKYINQKQMGAYYTKEDITGYISRNTIIPFLFDNARQKCRIAFEGGHSIWQILQDDPDRYIYEAVKHGIVQNDNVHRNDEHGNVGAKHSPAQPMKDVSTTHETDLLPQRMCVSENASPLPSVKPLPPEIAAGITDVSKRVGWNKPVPPEYGLPTETWREVVARRLRYEEIYGKLSRGEVRDINDLITYNLDICQFAEDVIRDCEGPELLRAFWHAIESVTILDPTCGSGAFLFAALNILESLYEACLDRMHAFLDELEYSGERHRPEKYSDFRKILERVEGHPSRKYFVFKSIVINNLFGVDIMDEAVEICKLRLFLKLVAQVEHVEDIEPLPDIDFNIRAGNTLVGFVALEQIKKAITTEKKGQVTQKKLLQTEDIDTMKRIDEKAQNIDRLFALFRQQQTELGGEVTTADKQELKKRLKVLEEELNHYLASEYG